MPRVRVTVEVRSGAVLNMAVGPPESAGMSRYQTTLSCCILRNMVVSVKEKAGNSQV
ncbi:hypothetical protein [Candidatus Tisiphia endosymbiont of Empis tessellata]|uniref:hypothetical protein n=1 Tax=Candidatus Tisiphia endosymbiont of Empis tessellata TaxID=3066259 RepID=UPI00313B36BA